jgi:thiol-disulfide isomerase/thioredoxin
VRELSWPGVRRHVFPGPPARARSWGALLLGLGAAWPVGALTAQDAAERTVPREAPAAPVLPPATDAAGRVEALTVGSPVPADLELLPLPPAPQAGADEPPSERAPVTLLSLAQEPGDSAAPRSLVVFFSSARCPFCRRYAPALREVVKDYRDRVRFAVVFPNATEGDEHIRVALDEARLAVPAFTDRRQRAADRLGVRVTPVAVVVDAAGVLRYRGPVDDDRRRRERDTTDHLRAALDAVLAGRPVETAEPRAFGSSVRRAAPAR